MPLYALRLEIVQGLRRLNLEKILGSADYAPDLLLMSKAIEESKFRGFPPRLLGRGMFPSFSSGRTDGGLDYRFYNTFNSCFISNFKATNVVRGMNRRLPSGHPVRWNYFEIDEDFVRSKTYLTSFRASRCGWGYASDSSGDEVEVDGDVEASEENVHFMPSVLTDDGMLMAVPDHLFPVGEVP